MSEILNKLHKIPVWTSKEIADFCQNECHEGHPFDKRKFIRKDKVVALIEKLELSAMKGNPGGK